MKAGPGPSLNVGVQPPGACPSYSLQACVSHGVDSAQVIYAGLEEDFPSDEDAWDLRARRHLGALAPPSAADSAAAALDSAATAAGVLEAAVAALPTARMYDAYAAFLTERLDELTPAASTSAGTAQPQRLHGRAKKVGVA